MKLSQEALAAIEAIKQQRGLTHKSAVQFYRRQQKATQATSINLAIQGAAADIEKAEAVAAYASSETPHYHLGDTPCFCADGDPTQRLATPAETAAIIENLPVDEPVCLVITGSDPKDLVARAMLPVDPAPLDLGAALQAQHAAAVPERETTLAITGDSGSVAAAMVGRKRTPKVAIDEAELAAMYEKAKAAMRNPERPNCKHGHPISLANACVADLKRGKYCCQPCIDMYRTAKK